MSHKRADSTASTVSEEEQLQQPQQQGDEYDEESGLVTTPRLSGHVAPVRALTASLTQEEILGIFAEINELAEQKKNLPSAAGKLSALAEAFITDFIRGAWSPTVIGLMINYDPTGWSQLISNLAKLPTILVSAGLISGLVNGVTGLAKYACSPASETAVFIQELRDLNQRALNEARALQRLVLVDWDRLLTAEAEMIPSRLAEIQAQLQIQSAEEYVSHSNPDSKVGTLYNWMQVVLSAANYTVSGVLATKLGFDFFGEKIELNGLDWRAGVGLGVGTTLAVLGAGLNAYRAQVEKRNLRSDHDEVCFLIDNTESLMGRSRELYEELRMKCGLAQIDYRVGRGYGTASNEPKLENFVTEMKQRADMISPHAELYGLFRVNQQPAPSLPNQFARGWN